MSEEEKYKCTRAHKLTKILDQWYNIERKSLKKFVESK